jgi:hypothetical protein
MQRLEFKATGAAIAVATGVLFGTSAQAQSLSGIKIGEEISSASKIAARRLPSKSVDPHEEQRWKLPDGNRLSVAADPKSKRIAYAEKKWGGGANGKPADFPGFVYGETTLADIRAHAQNNGFAFKEHHRREAVRPHPVQRVRGRGCARRGRDVRHQAVPEG